MQSTVVKPPASLPPPSKPYWNRNHKLIVVVQKVKIMIFNYILRLARLIYRVVRFGQSLLFTSLVKFKVKSVGSVKVNSYSKVTSNTVLGYNVNFNGMLIIGCGEVIIGNNFHSGQDCLVISQNHNYEGVKIPYDETVICKKVIIEDNVWFGARVIVLPGAHIGEGAIVQAGSVVHGTIDKYSIVGGNPAVKFSMRDSVRYEMLKKDKKFH